MAYATPPAKNEISATPSPTNAVAKAGFGKLWDWLTALFGTGGKPEHVYSALKLLDPKAIYNLAASFSVNANELTITITDKDGNALSADNPGFVGQRHATLSNGGFLQRKLEANLSLVISAGSTLGHTANVLHPLYIYLIDNAGVQELAATSTYLGEAAIVSTTAEGGAGAADSATEIYSTTARSNVAARLVAVAWFKQSTAGNWVNLPTRLQAAPFILTSPQDLELLRGVIRGLETANNAVDAANDIDIAPGSVLDDKALAVLTLAATLTKQIDTAWAVGTNQGGLDTGAVANDTWYYLWLIGRSDTGVVDALFSTSSSAPTMPANYDRKKLIGAVRRETAANAAYYQDGDWFRWRANVAVVSGGTNTTNTAVSLTPAVPPIARSFAALGRTSVTTPGAATSTNELVVQVAAGVDYGILCSVRLTASAVAENFTRAGSVEIPCTGTFNYRNEQTNSGSRNASIFVSGYRIAR